MKDFTQAELDVIAEGLDRMISDGLVENGDDPIVTAYEKITGNKVYEADHPQPITFDEFYETVCPYSRSTCIYTIDVRGNPVYATMDWRIIYDLRTQLWSFSEDKTFVGRGSTLKEAMSNVPSLNNQF